MFELLTLYKEYKDKIYAEHEGEAYSINMEDYITFFGFMEFLLEKVGY